jgi:hypothetical protein
MPTNSFRCRPLLTSSPRHAKISLGFFKYSKIHQARMHLASLDDRGHHASQAETTT